MKKNIRFLLCNFLLMMFCQLTSCTKLIDDYIDNKLNSPKNLLCRSWVKTAEIHNPPNLLPNLFNSSLPCAKDNESKFNKDGSYELNQGNSVCYAGQPFIIEQGNWSFLQGEKQLKISSNNGNTERVYDIVKLDTNYNFITTYTQVVNGNTVTIREEFDPR